MTTDILIVGYTLPKSTLMHAVSVVRKLDRDGRVTHSGNQVALCGETCFERRPFMRFDAHARMKKTRVCEACRDAADQRAVDIACGVKLETSK